MNLSKKNNIFILFLISVMILTTGCTSQYYKSEADKEVYQIIDDKWQNRHGPKSNYLVNDVNYQDVNQTPDIKPLDIPPETTLTLAQAVAIATAQNRDYQTRKESLYLTALDLTLVRYSFARQWFATFDANYDNTPTDESVDYGTQVGFTQLLADGALISTSIAVDWLRFLTGDPRTSLGSALTATISQPLLRGAGRKIVQENLTQAERNVLYQIRNFSRFRKTFVVSIVSQYYRVLQSYDSVKNAESNYESLVFAYDRAKMLADAGRIKRFEVDQTEQDKLRAKDNLTTALQRYQQQLDQFKIEMGITTDKQIALDVNELNALADYEISEPNFPLEEAVDTALQYRLDLATSFDQVEDAKRKVIVAEDDLGAELNLIGSASVASETGETDIERLQFDDGFYSLGLELDLPLDRKAERNAYRESLITFAQRKRAYDLDVDNVKLDIRDAYRRLIEAATKYEIQRRSLLLAKERVNNINMLLEAGRATSRDLLEAQEALLSAQNNITSALVDYTITKLNFYRDLGLLNVRPDGFYQYQQFFSKNG